MQRKNIWTECFFKMHPRNTLFSVIIFALTCFGLFPQTFAQDDADKPFVIPEVKIEAFSPKGFRVSLPDGAGIQMFAFHGQRNKQLSSVEPGELYKDVTSPSGNSWVYYDPNVRLQKGDVIHYWYFVQHNRLGYRKEEQKFQVENLDSIPTEPSCKKSTVTRYNGGKIPCEGNVIFEDNFIKYSTLDDEKWLHEEFIPSNNGPDYEFVIYKKDNRTVFVEDSVAHFKPVESNLASGVLDLKHCTKSKDKINDEQCTRGVIGPIPFPPFFTGLARSKFSFQHGVIEIRAKVPQGDWIYPVIQLKTLDETKSIIIALVRGNQQLRTSSGEEIGATVVESGFQSNDSAPILRRKSFSSPISNDFHTFSLEWRQNEATFKIDQDVITTYKLNEPGLEKVYTNPAIVEKFGGFEDTDQEYRIYLGTSVGGILFFPDDSVSGNQRKPWKNKTVRMVRDFKEQLAVTKRSWIENAYDLKVKSVKVKSL